MELSPVIQIIILLLSPTGILGLIALWLKMRADQQNAVLERQKLAEKAELDRKQLVAKTDSDRNEILLNIQQFQTQATSALLDKLVTSNSAGLFSVRDAVMENNKITTALKEGLANSFVGLQQKQDSVATQITNFSEESAAALEAFRTKALSDLNEVPDRMFAKIDPAILALNNDVSALSTLIGQMHKEVQAARNELINAMISIAGAQENIVATQDVLVKAGRESIETLNSLEKQLSGVDERVTKILGAFSKAAQQNTPPEGTPIPELKSS